MPPQDDDYGISLDTIYWPDINNVQVVIYQRGLSIANANVNGQGKFALDPEAVICEIARRKNLTPDQYVAAYSYSDGSGRAFKLTVTVTTPKPPPAVIKIERLPNA